MKFAYVRRLVSHSDTNTTLFARMAIKPANQLLTKLVRVALATGSVRPRVRHEDTETAAQKQLRIAGHPEAVIAETVQQNHGVSVAVAWTNAPGAKGYSVSRSDSDVGQLGVMKVCHFTCFHLIPRRLKVSAGMQRHLGQKDSRYG